MPMNDYIIATSSTADLPRTWLDEHHIPFISYNFTVNGALRQDDCRDENRAESSVPCVPATRIHVPVVAIHCSDPPLRPFSEGVIPLL